MWFEMSTIGERSRTGELYCLCLKAYLLNAPPRPQAFIKSSAYPEDSDDEESTVGKMPPSDSEDEQV
jgi:hypothetical protein